MALSFFGKSKGSDEAENGNGNGDGNGNGNGNGNEAAPSFNPEPDKARKWFDQARLTADTRNYEYAITCYLSGLKFDPANMEAHQNLFEVAGLYKSTGGKAATGKEIREIGSGKTTADKFVAAELAWVKDALNASLALKFTKAAADMGLQEVAFWSGEMGVKAVLRSKKPTKNALMNFVDIFEQINAADRAMQYAQMALQLDPSDTQLETRIRNLSAQSTMNKGGYEDNIGEEGGFRKSIQDIDKQIELTEEDSMALGSEGQSRRLTRAKDEWEAEPNDQNTISKYSELLRKIADDENDKEAIRVLLDGFKKTQQYRFRMLAGDTKLAMERRKLRAMREKATATGSTDDLAKVEDRERRLKDAEITEFQERVEKYPTDLRIKFELGKRLFDVDRFDDAIPVLQDALDDARNKSATNHLIGLCFLKQEWFEEATESLREAVESYELKDDDTHLGMRYDLMEALAAHAADQSELEVAEEAFTLARGIAMKKLNFREIKGWRDKLRTLVKELKNK